MSVALPLYVVTIADADLPRVTSVYLDRKDADRDANARGEEVLLYKPAAELEELVAAADELRYAITTERAGSHDAYEPLDESDAECAVCIAAAKYDRARRGDGNELRARIRTLQVALGAAQVELGKATGALADAEERGAARGGNALLGMLRNALPEAFQETALSQVPERAFEAITQLREAWRQTPPIPRVLHCPNCGQQHLDIGEFATRVHRKHLCQNTPTGKTGCGHLWVPFQYATRGVFADPEQELPPETAQP